jgi:tripartite ATP-independent transporter DctP family solute receptor
MKKLVCIAVVVCAALLIVALPRYSQAEAKYTIKYYSVAPPFTPANVVVQQLKEELSKKTKGDVDINLFLGGQLGAENVGLNQIQMGAVQTGVIAGTVVSVIEPKVNAWLLPFMFKDMGDVEKLLSSPAADEVAKSLEKKGLKLLGLTTYGFFNLMHKNKSIMNVEDFKGLKLRVIPVPILVDVYKTLGASPTPIAFPEVYTALQQGVVDGTDASYDTANASKQYEIAKYFVLSNHIHGTFFYLANKKWFDGLPKNIQVLLTDGFRKAAKDCINIYAKNDAELKAKFEKAGVTIKQLPDANREALKKATYPVHEKYRGSIGSDYLELVYKTVGYTKP